MAASNPTPVRPPQVPPAATSPLALLDSTRLDVDRVLPEIPDNRLEARRMITREWKLDPSPAELQVIVDMAHDPAGQHRLPQELARATLAARLFVARELSQLLDSERLDAERIRRAARVLPQLLRAVSALGAQMGSILKISASAEREFLSKVVAGLLPSGESLISAAVVAPHLERLALSASAADIRQILPALTDTELATLAASVCPDPGRDIDPAGEGQTSRLYVDAIVLGAVIRDDVDRMEKLVESDRATRSSDRRKAFEQLLRDKTAYDVTSERVRRQRNAAYLAGLSDYAETLRGHEQSLLADHRRLVAVVNTERPGTIGIAGEPMEAADLQRLLEESAEQDALADVVRSGEVTKEEICLNALRGVDAPRELSQPVFVSEYDVKRERRRIRVLSILAAVLFVAWAGLWTARFRTGPDPLAVESAEISDTLILDRSFKVGPMLYAVVSHWSWDHIDDEERLANLRALGLSAANKGYQTVYLVDENRKELAMWSAAGGARLMGAAAAGDATHATAAPR